MSIRKQEQLLAEGEKLLGDQVLQESQKTVEIGDHAEALDDPAGRGASKPSAQKANPILPREQYLRNSTGRASYSNQT